MKTKLSILFVAIVCISCSQGTPNGKSAMPAPKSNEEIATFAGGCFWAMQECMNELKGVDKVISGYAGGAAANPTYEQVSSRDTGHAESVQVYYDPKVITFAQLTEAFLYAHDPTQLNRQGPDIGTDYRSIAFYRNAEEKATIQNIITKVNNSRHYPAKIVTEITAFKTIYPAENYHQNYYNLHADDSYIVNVSQPKVMKLRKAMPQLIKSQYK
jgi:peptide-methionine (S)-S-oxide reductase